MSKPLPRSDFRAVRIVLETEEYALGPRKEPPPSDLIDKKTWHDIMTLPDSVSIRTSNHQGSLLKIMNDLLTVWTEFVERDQGPLALFVAEELQAAIFNALYGYYRQAIGCLRNALEQVVIVTYCQVCDKSADYAHWQAGRVQISFDKACNGLARAPFIQPLEAHIRTTLDDSIFGQKTRTHTGGWARRMYSGLSDFLHPRPGSTNADMWKSNGPTHASGAFVSTAEKYIRAFALCLILVKLSRHSLSLPQDTLQVFEPAGIQPMEIIHVVYQYLFLSEGQNAP